MKRQMCVDLYQEFKNVAVVAEKLQMPWSTVHWHLTKAGVPLTGDKSLYGSVRDKVALIGETRFKEIVPWAKNQNEQQFQSKFDFKVGELKVDVKTSKFKSYNAAGSKRYSFSLKKKDLCFDFIVLVGIGEFSEESLWLIPCEMLRENIRTISIPPTSKWNDFLVTEQQLVNFFEDFK